MYTSPPSTLSASGRQAQADTGAAKPSAKSAKAPAVPEKRGRKPANASKPVKTTSDTPETDGVPKPTTNGKLKSVGRPKRALSTDPAPTARAPKRVASHSTAPKAPRPLFTAKALRASFNPLPQPDPLLSGDGRRSERCGNPLNALTFDPHPWLHLPLGAGMSKCMLMFGAGDMGQMGLGSDKLDDIKKPVIHVLVEELKRELKMGSSSGPETVACGGMHSLLVDGSGQIWSWGINDNAALGRRTEGIEGIDQEELESRPMVVEELVQTTGSQPFRAVRVSAGDSVSVAVSDQGETRAWGSFRVSLTGSLCCTILGVYFYGFFKKSLADMFESLLHSRMTDC